MAKIDYAFPVEKIHGKISKKHKIGFAHRTASGVNYSTAYGKRRTKPSTPRFGAMSSTRCISLGRAKHASVLSKVQRFSSASRLFRSTPEPPELSEHLNS